MKTFNRVVSSASILLSSLFFMDGIACGQNVPFSVGLFAPTNHQMFGAPANIYVHAQLTDSNVIQTVQYFSGATSIGIVSNTSAVLVTNLTQGNPLFITWSNVPAGAYSLTAVARDSAGNVATSAPVNITVTNPIVHPAVYIYSPTNGAMFLTPANLTVYARSVESSGTVATVQFFANNASLGVVSNSSQMVFTNIGSELLFPLAWSNVLTGSYALKAVATDTHGITATSSVVNIYVVTNIPPPIVRPSVVIYSPTNLSKFVAPASINIYARANEGSTGTVATVQFFANSLSLGVVSNSSQMVVSNISSAPLFPLTWSNAPVGSYYLKAVATDAVGMSSTSALVSISVVTNAPPPIIPFVIGFLYPTNGQTYLAPANVGIRVLLADSNIVRTVQYFSGTTSIGIITNTSNALLTNSTQSNPFYLTWSNVSAGNYTLSALATDSAGLTATSPPVTITITNKSAPNIPFSIGFWYPTNGQTFIAPANIGVHALVVDSNVVQTMQYFANGSSIGIVTNTSSVLLTNTSQGNPFFLSWSNVPAGSYALTAVAADSLGYTATSSVVNILVTNLPPPVIHPAAYIYSPATGATYLVPATVKIYARAYESTGMVATVEFFANSVSLGVVSNSSQMIVSIISSVPLFPLTWSNVPAGSYSLKVIATDTNGNTGTSSVVNISVVTNYPPPNVPFAVSFWYPTNGQIFLAPANIGIHARVTDSNVVQTIQYFADGSSLGTVTNSGGVLLTNSTQANSFYLSWSNVPAGSYALTALATDSAGNTATSAPVHIYVLTNLPPVINIYATDPVAIEGTNYLNWYNPTSSICNYVSGANTATFLVHRDSATNTDLTVYYSIGGTAYNGEDYATLPGWVTIAAGRSYALITIYPLDDMDSSYRYYDSVVLSLIPSPLASNSPATYRVGSPQQAGAVILEENFLPIPNPVIRSLDDSSLHVSLPATNGMNFCLQISTDLMNWLPVCTNTVLKGSAQFVDPSGTGGTGLYYRIVPVATPAAY